MGFFSCKHSVPMKDMKNITVDYDSVGEWATELGATVRYQGFCRHCNSLVSLTEEIQNRALHQYLQLQTMGTLTKS